MSLAGFIFVCAACNSSSDTQQGNAASAQSTGGAHQGGGSGGVDRGGAAGQASGASGGQGGAGGGCLSLGATCQDGSECCGGNCVDGVCCDAACGNGDTGDCQACSEALGASVDGTCGPVMDGSACDDGDLCTQVDTCQLGSCSGGSPVVCMPLDECHDAGTCNTTTGICNDPNKPNGAPCSLGVCLNGVCVDSGGGTVSAHHYGGIDMEGATITLDNAGNIILAGFYHDVASFGGAALASAYPSDVFVAKYTPSGAHLWSNRYGGADAEKVRAVAVDSSNNIIVVGYFKGTANFGGGALVSAGNEDVFVAKYNPSGTVLWQRRIGAAGRDAAYDVAVDSQNAIVLGGYFESTVDFGNSNSLTASSGRDAFLTKLDSSGTTLWARRYGTTSGDGTWGVATLGTDIVATGYCVTSCTFGSQTLTGSGNVFVTKLNGSGTHLWAARYGGSSREIGTSVAVAPNGLVIVAGYFGGAAGFGGATLTSAGSWDAFVAAYSGSSGSHQWSQSFGGALRDSARDVAVDGSGNVLVTGLVMDDVDLGLGVTSTAGALDAFVIKIPAGGGTPLWANRYGGAGWDEGTSLAYEPSGNTVFVTGSFSQQVNFGLGPLTSSGDEDVFVLEVSGGTP